MAFKLRNPFTPRTTDKASPELMDRERANDSDIDADGARSNSGGVIVKELRPDTGIMNQGTAGVTDADVVGDGAPDQMAAGVVKTKTKSNQSNDRLGHEDDPAAAAGDGAGDGASDEMAASVLKTKTKSNQSNDRLGHEDDPAGAAGDGSDDGASDEMAASVLKNKTKSNQSNDRLGEEDGPAEAGGDVDGDGRADVVADGFGMTRTSVQDFEKNTENVSGGFAAGGFDRDGAAGVVQRSHTSVDRDDPAYVVQNNESDAADDGGGQGGALADDGARFKSVGGLESETERLDGDGPDGESLRKNISINLRGEGATGESLDGGGGDGARSVDFTDPTRPSVSDADGDRGLAAARQTPKRDFGDRQAQAAGEDSDAAPEAAFNTSHSDTMNMPGVTAGSVRLSRPPARDQDDPGAGAGIEVNDPGMPPEKPSTTRETGPSAPVEGKPTKDQVAGASDASAGGGGSGADSPPAEGKVVLGGVKTSQESFRVAAGDVNSDGSTGTVAEKMPPAVDTNPKSVNLRTNDPDSDGDGDGASDDGTGVHDEGARATTRIDNTPARLSTNMTIERQQQQAGAVGAGDDDGDAGGLQASVVGSADRPAIGDGQDRWTAELYVERSAGADPGGGAAEAKVSMQDISVMRRVDDDIPGAAGTKNSMQGNTGTKAADDGMTKENPLADEGMTRSSDPVTGDDPPEGYAVATVSNDDANVGLEVANADGSKGVVTGLSPGTASLDPDSGAAAAKVYTSADGKPGEGGADEPTGIAIGDRGNIAEDGEARFAKIKMDYKAREAGSGMATGKAVGDKDHGTEVDEASADAERMSGKISLVREPGTSGPSSDSIAVSDDGGTQAPVAREQKKWLTSNFREEDPDDEEPSMLLDLSGNADEDGVITVADLDFDGPPEEADVDIDGDTDTDKFELTEATVDG